MPVVSPAAVADTGAGERFRTLARDQLPRLYSLARLHRGRKLFEKHLWVYAERHDLLKERPR